MPRKPRFYLPDVPCHIILRGKAQHSCFKAVADYQYYLDVLKEASREYSCQIHSYVLLPDHVHLLATPGTQDGITRLMKSVGCSYVQYFNKTYNRSGSLWGDRGKVSLVDLDSYLFLSFQYIENTPVRTGLAAMPESYPWSSYRHYACGDHDQIIADHKIYRNLGCTRAERMNAYREIFKRQPKSGMLNVFHDSLNAGMPLGCDDFKKKIQRELKRDIGYATRGRPRKHVSLDLNFKKAA